MISFFVSILFHFYIMQIDKEAQSKSFGSLHDV